MTGKEVRKLKKFINSTAITLALGLTWLAYGAPVLADVDIEKNINLGAPADWEERLPSNVSLATIISSTLQILLIAGAVFFFIYLLIGGIRWIMSAGDKSKIEAARGQITHAIVGLLIVLGVWVVHGVLKSLFGIDLLGELKLPNFTE